MFVYIMNETLKTLYAQAKILNVPGRSKMNKQELQKAIKNCMKKISEGKIYVKTCKT